VSSKLIAFEGIDGSGKSTLLKNIKEELEKRGYRVETFATREEEYEDLFNSVVKTLSPDQYSPAYMFFFQLLHAHKADRVKEALKRESIVLVDRWDLSFFVWHENFGFFSKESPTLRTDISRLAFDNINLDLGIYLDVTLDNAFDRRIWRGEAIEDVEKERALYTTVISGYHDLVKRFGWKTINGNMNFKEVIQATLKLVLEIL